MSDSKRATLITVGATKSSNNNVNKTVRLTINLDESNESKYPELNYKELVTAEEKIKKLENGKTKGLDPFSDIDDDVEQVARKFEQKYGGKSTYGKKGRTKADDFADIGAGYDENDSFIDNTDGYDEMIPPGCDTLYGGFYINCGDLMFKSVPGNQIALSDCEPGSRKNKHFASSSSDESSESSSESSHDEKDTKPAVNGDVDSHNTEHRKKKNKKMDKIQPKKKHRTDSSAATSGKQTSDDNIPNEGESADSRTSHSDSLTSKPAPSSENVATSDSSRDVETKVEVKLPPHVAQIVDELMSLISKHKTENAGLSAQQLLAKMEPNLFRLDRVLQKPHASTTARRIAWTKIAKCMKMSRSALLQRVKHLCGDTQPPPPATSAQQISPTNATPATNTTATATTRTTTTTTNNKRKTMDSDAATNNISDEQREKCIVDTLKRLKTLIDEKTPGMMATYNAECERVQEERKKIQIASSSGSAPHVEKRLPKRRFPWCPASRKLLIALTQIAGDESKAVELLTRRALPLFPSGFVRLPTLLRQADLSKEAKGAETKRPRLGSATQSSKAITATTPITTTAQSQTFTEPITFPAALTVTTSNKISPDKTETLNNTEEKDKKSNSVFGSLLNSFSISKDLVVETESRLKEDKGKEDLYIPPNSIGSITITPVPSQNQKTDKKVNDTGERLKEPLLKIKSPAALNEMVNKEVKKDKDKLKKDKNNVKEKRVNSPLHIDTSYQTNKKTPSPKDEIAQNLEISKKRIESMRNAENNIPRPALVPVHHSPTFAKPDKRPPEVKKKKEIVIMSDVDPLAEVPNEPVSIDDSDSDVELIEDSRNVDSVNSDVPSMDKVTNTKKDSAKVTSDRNEQLDAPTKEDIDIVMRNLREMEHSQEPTKLNSFGGVITNVRHKSSHGFNSAMFGDGRSNKNIFAEGTSLNKTDGCNNSITG